MIEGENQATFVLGSQRNKIFIEDSDQLSWRLLKSPRELRIHSED